jgi:hypothetical protein
MSKRFEGESYERGNLRLKFMVHISFIKREAMVKKGKKGKKTEPAKPPQNPLFEA